MGVEIAAVGERKDFGFPINVTLDADTLSTPLAVSRHGALTLQGRLENLFDEDYCWRREIDRGSFVHCWSTLELRSTPKRRWRYRQSLEQDLDAHRRRWHHRPRRRRAGCKDQIRVEVYGTVDEANSVIGAISAVPDGPPRWSVA